MAFRVTPSASGPAASPGTKVPRERNVISNGVQCGRRMDFCAFRNGERSATPSSWIAGMARNRRPVKRASIKYLTLVSIDTSTWDKRQDYHVCTDAKPQLDNSTIAEGGFAIREINL